MLPAAEPWAREGRGGVACPTAEAGTRSDEDDDFLDPKESTMGTDECFRTSWRRSESVSAVEAQAGYACHCGERFAPSLLGAWEAKMHVEDHGHRLRRPRDGESALPLRIHAFAP
jgi:hypothetical protein